MSRSRRFRCVFAALLGWALVAGTFQAAAAPVTARVAAAAVVPAVPVVPPVLVAPAVLGTGGAPTATGPGAVRASEPAGPGSSPDAASAFAFASGAPGGPACAPGSGGRDGVPALPARAGSDQAQAQAPPVRPGPELAVPSRAIPVRVLVRGPGQSAPSSLELSVMRV